jgi:hypothetical protein
MMRLALREHAGRSPRDGRARKSSCPGSVLDAFHERPPGVGGRDECGAGVLGVLYGDDAGEVAGELDAVPAVAVAVAGLPPPAAEAAPLRALRLSDALRREADRRGDVELVDLPRVYRGE